MTDKVDPSYNRAAKSDEIAQIIAGAAGSRDGYVVPSDSVFLADRDADLDETALNAFVESHSASSFDVTIDPGEAIVNGAWLARDVSTTVSLDSGTAGQMVYVGWDTSETAGAGDTVIIGTDVEFSSSDYRIPLWEFDTDGSGVTASYDHRDLGNRAFAERFHADYGLMQGQTLPSGEQLTIPRGEAMVVGGEYDAQGDLDVQGRMDIVSGSPSHKSIEETNPDDHLNLLASETITVSGGTQPGYDGWINDVIDDEYAKFDVVASVESGLDNTYAYNYDISRRWKNGSWDIGITVNWDNDPGSDMKLRIDVHER